MRDNILFSLPYDQEKYQQVIRLCALEPDLEVLPNADLTPIGDRGINLSGGQVSTKYSYSITSLRLSLPFGFWLIISYLETTG